MREHQVADHGAKVVGNGAPAGKVKVGDNEVPLANKEVAGMEVAVDEALLVRDEVHREQPCGARDLDVLPQGLDERT